MKRVQKTDLRLQKQLHFFGTVRESGRVNQGRAETLACFFELCKFWIDFCCLSYPGLVTCEQDSRDRSYILLAIF